MADLSAGDAAFLLIAAFLWIGFAGGVCVTVCCAAVARYYYMALYLPLVEAGEAPYRFV